MIEYETLIKKIITDTINDNIEWEAITNHQCMSITENTDFILNAFKGKLFLDNKCFKVYFLKFKELTDSETDFVWFKLVIDNDTSVIINFSDSDVNKTYFLRLFNAICAHNKDADEFRKLYLGKEPDEILENGENLKNKIDSIKKWFLSIYEDPAEKTPYDSHEGGYQYKKGEPYNAKEVLFEQFHDECNEEIINKAASELENENLTTEWVKK